MTFLKLHFFEIFAHCAKLKNQSKAISVSTNLASIDQTNIMKNLFLILFIVIGYTKADIDEDILEGSEDLDGFHLVKQSVEYDRDILSDFDTMENDICLREDVLKNLPEKAKKDRSNTSGKRDLYQDYHNMMMRGLSLLGILNFSMHTLALKKKLLLPTLVLLIN